MLNLGNAPFTPENIRLLETSISNYWRHARIRLSIEARDEVVYVTISQPEPAPNGKLLNRQELSDRAHEAVEGLLPQNYLLVVTADTDMA